MKCPICGGPSRIAAQTLNKLGCLAIVRECTAEDGNAHVLARFETMEVPSSVVAQFGAARFAEKVERALRGYRTRAECARKREVVRQLAGTQPATAIAHLLGITETRVRQIFRELHARGELPQPRVRVHRLSDEQRIRVPAEDK